MRSEERMLDIAPSSSLHPVADAVHATLPMLRASQAGSRLRVAGLRGAARAFFLARCYQLTPQPTLCVLPSQDAAEAFADDVRFFLGGAEGSRVHLYPAWDVPPFEGLSPSNEILAGQIEGLYYLLSTENPIMVAPIEALAQRVFPQEELIASILSVKTGQDIVLSDLVDHLVQWGYRRVPLVEEKGEVGVRGGIIDLFPPLADEPL